MNKIGLCPRKYNCQSNDEDSMTMSTLDAESAGSDKLIAFATTDGKDVTSGHLNASQVRNIVMELSAWLGEYRAPVARPLWMDEDA